MSYIFYHVWIHTGNYLILLFYTDLNVYFRISFSICYAWNILCYIIDTITMSTREVLIIRVYVYLSRSNTPNVCYRIYHCFVTSSDNSFLILENNLLYSWCIVVHWNVPIDYVIYERSISKLLLSNEFVVAVKINNINNNATWYIVIVYVQNRLQYSWKIYRWRESAVLVT